jgi:hypothetical protein
MPDALVYCIYHQMMVKKIGGMEMVILKTDEELKIEKQEKEEYATKFMNEVGPEIDKQLSEWIESGKDEDNFIFDATEINLPVPHLLTVNVLPQTMFGSVVKEVKLSSNQLKVIDIVMKALYKEYMHDLNIKCAEEEAETKVP